MPSKTKKPPRRAVAKRPWVEIGGDEDQLPFGIFGWKRKPYRGRARQTRPVLDARAIGARIRAARKARFWSYDDLCQKAGIRRGTLGAFESGHRIPNRGNAIRLATALRRTLDWLLLGRHGRGKSKDG